MRISDWSSDVCSSDLARAFGLSIHYHNRKRLPAAIEEELGASYHASVDTLLRISDVVTIHCPHTGETHEMVNAARIAAMKPTAYLINTARGEIVDEKADRKSTRPNSSH